MSPGALLHAAGAAVTSFEQRDVALAADRVADRNGGDIHAINISLGFALDGGEGLDGTAHLTQFVDWSAKEHDVLYVIAGREDSGGEGPVPTTNYNGITVASSARDIGGGGWSNVWSGNNYNDDAAGSNRVSVDLIAPGELVDAVDVGGGLANPARIGTSFAAPHVTAAVALLQEYAVASAAISTPGWNSGNARRHEVMKAILLNSAEKISGVHGASRTHRNRFGQLWDQTTAHNDPDTPLDLHFGAGHLNVSSAITNYSSGEQNPNPGPVSLTGWDYGSVGGTFVDYELNGTIGGDTWVAVTLAWDREVAMTGFGSNYTSTSDFFDRPIGMELENLDLYFMPASSSNINDAIFKSTATGDSVEHIFEKLDVGAGGNYKIRVVNSGGPQGFADFGLAWRTVAAPTLGDNDGDGDVDGDDLALWQGDYALNSDSDADGDGDTDGSDFLAWQRQFTNTGPTAVYDPATGGITLKGVDDFVGLRIESTDDSLLAGAMTDLNGAVTGGLSSMNDQAPEFVEWGNLAGMTFSSEFAGLLLPAGLSLSDLQSNLSFTARSASDPMTDIFGSFELAASQSLAAVPEPSSLLLAMLGLPICWTGRRKLAG